MLSEWETLAFHSNDSLGPSTLPGQNKLGLFIIVADRCTFVDALNFRRFNETRTMKDDLNLLELELN